MKKKKAKKKNTKKVIKSAASGKFMSRKYAKCEPHKTFRQTVKK